MDGRSNGQDFSLSLITEFMEGKVLPKADFFSFLPDLGRINRSSPQKRCPSKRGVHFPVVVQHNECCFFTIVANYG